MKRLNILIFLLLATWANISAALVEVSATMDSTTLLIGEQRTIHIEAKFNKSVEMKFPEINKETPLATGIEILRTSQRDTVDLKAGNVIVSQDIVVTSFDTGRYEIPPFRFTTIDQHYMSDKIIVDVVTIEEDFTKASLTANNDVYRPPFNFKRLFQYLSFLLILAGIIYVIVLSVITYNEQKKRGNDMKFDTVDKRSPREVALTNLNEIKEEQVWKTGEQKRYHTEITDTLRHYFQERFKVSAMEMTSDEIIEEMKSIEEANVVEDKVRQVFKLSDMVKFAKYEASNEENEMSIVNALFIVQQTSQVEEETTPTDSNDSSKSIVKKEEEEEEFKL